MLSSTQPNKERHYRVAGSMKNIKEELLKETEVLFSSRSSEPFILQSPGALNELFEKEE